LKPASRAAARLVVAGILLGRVYVVEAGIQGGGQEPLVLDVAGREV